METNLLDRVAALAPLGVLLYVLRRHESERAKLLETLERDREAFRHERRELFNRVQFPTAMPVASRPTDRPAPLRPKRTAGAAAREEALAEARNGYSGIGVAEPPDLTEFLPRDGDEAPA